MSLNPAADLPSEKPPRRSILKVLANIGIVCFFAVGVVVAAGSFGLFGCLCMDTNQGPGGMEIGLPYWRNWGQKRNVPEDKAADSPRNVGEMPPLPTPK